MVTFTSFSYLGFRPDDVRLIPTGPLGSPAALAAVSVHSHSRQTRAGSVVVSHVRATVVLSTDAASMAHRVTLFGLLAHDQFC